MRFNQVSCIGASSSSPSKLLRAKAAPEEAILRTLPEVTIYFLSYSAVMISMLDNKVLSQVIPSEQEYNAIWKE